MPAVLVEDVEIHPLAHQHRVIARDPRVGDHEIFFRLASDRERGFQERDLAFVGMPGEPFVEFQMQLRAKSPLPNSFLLGYTNGYFAYFPTIAAAVRGGYGADSTVVPTEVGTGERMLNAGLISIYELLGKLSSKPGKAQP